MLGAVKSSCSRAREASFEMRDVPRFFCRSLRRDERVATGARRAVDHAVPADAARAVGSLFAMNSTSTATFLSAAGLNYERRMKDIVAAQHTRILRDRAQRELVCGRRFQHHTLCDPPSGVYSH